MKFSDILFSRYSQPMQMLEQFIRILRFSEMTEEIFGIVSESQMWEFWLHRETGKSWEDFKLSVLPQDADTDKLSKTVCDIENAFAKGVI